MALLILSFALLALCHHAVRADEIVCEVWGVPCTDDPDDPFICTPIDGSSLTYFIETAPEDRERVDALCVKGGEIVKFTDVEVSKERTTIIVDANSKMITVENMECVWNTDCSKSDWCEDETMEAYCPNHTSFEYCPGPMCIWTEKTDLAAGHRRRTQATRKADNSRALTPTMPVVKTAVVLRISANDSEPTWDAALMSKRVFGPEDDDDLNPRQQLDLCTRGLLTVEKATNVPGAVDGVLEVMIPFAATDFNASSSYRNGVNICNEAKKVLEAQGINVHQLADLHLCAIPTTGSWFPGVAIGSKASAYWDVFVGSIACVLHEIAHNVGIGHSRSYTYGGDTIGVMYSCSTDHTGPHKCFNAFHAYRKGWNLERTLVLDSVSELPWTGELVGMSEYDLADEYPSEEYYVTWAFIHDFSEAEQTRSNGSDVFIMFNRATGINSGTPTGMANRVIVYTGASFAGGDSKRHGWITEQQSYKLANFTKELLDLEVRFLGITIRENGLYVANVEIGIDLPTLPPPTYGPFFFQVVDATAYCLAHDKGLGKSFANAEEAAQAAYDDPECTGDFIQFSRWSYSWGSFCCSRWLTGTTLEDNTKSHPNWGVFQFRGDPIEPRDDRRRRLGDPQQQQQRRMAAAGSSSSKGLQQQPSLFAEGSRCDAVAASYGQKPSAMKCAEAAYGDSSCTGDAVMWSAKSKECHCCRSPSTTMSVVEDSKWSLYHFRTSSAPSGDTQRQSALRRRMAAPTETQQQR